LAFVLGALLAPAPARAQAVEAAPLRTGEVSFAMRATKVNDFIGHAPVARAEFHGTDLAHVTGVVEVRVADMHTGIGLRDTHMRHAMNADSFPLVRFELAAVDVGAAHGDTTTVTFQGQLTIHGVTRTIRAPGYVVPRSAGVDVFASFPVDMREYGIEPPTRFFGAIRVAPVTTLGVQLSFGSP
jgi:polyisoprenoid-binding protein YceI